MFTYLFLICCLICYHLYVEMQESALLHSLLLLWNFYFLQWFLTLEKWKERWLELVWHGFLGSLVPLVALISLDWSLLSSWAVVPSLAEMLMLTAALAPFRDSAVVRSVNSSLAFAARNETVFVSRVDSHGNSNAFMGRLITVMMAN